LRSQPLFPAFRITGISVEGRACRSSHPKSVISHGSIIAPILHAFSNENCELTVTHPRFNRKRLLASQPESSCAYASTVSAFVLDFLVAMSDD
ncbi:hypothetical protein, partial [Mesorhizobium sp. M4B.F.Ca.ET.089.01.1.1]|uniref:hypothetical protein n=1 Tax=Mesorhizobium sp. M4B.F.Ca.ET.089.01.1.1 TaxID=2496662 RepID=UPI001AECD757